MPDHVTGRGRQAGDEPARNDRLTPFDWDQVNWTQVEARVRKRQERIFQKTKAGDFREVCHQQELLARSFDAHLLAVRRMTEINKGRSTPGVDGHTCKTHVDKIALVERLKDRDGYKPEPVYTIYIPKPDGGWRQLGIPTILDRAMQDVVRMALEPEWEAKFEPNSYGFRPGRGAIDAIFAVTSVLLPKKGLRPHPGWVLDADISKCFDNIDHVALLGKLASSPFHGLIAAWLRAGHVSHVGFENKDKGTPQGGIISPLLANIALDGLERLFGITNGAGNYVSPGRRKGPNKDIMLVRYADDFVVLAASKSTLLDHVIPSIKAFLADRGLSLNEAKTRVVNLDTGFDFLGFHFQRFHRRDGSVRTFVHQPRRSKVEEFAKNLSMVLRYTTHMTAKDVIKILNSKIRGFCNYFRWSDAHDMFALLQTRLWEMCWRWARRKHKGRNATWTKAHYWTSRGNDNWVFSEQGVDLIAPRSCVVVGWWRYPKVRMDASPYDASLKVYYARRKELYHSVVNKA